MTNNTSNEPDKSTYEIVASEVFTLVSGEVPQERWLGYKKVRQKSLYDGEECRFVGALLKETPKLYIMTSETNLESPLHFTRHLKKARFHIEPCAMCSDNQSD